jgi:integrase
MNDETPSNEGPAASPAVPPAPKPRGSSKRRGRGEGGIGRRDDGTWYATVSEGVSPDGRRLRKYFYGASKADVRKARDEYLAARAGGFDPTNESLGSYLTEWLRELEATAKVNTYGNYEWAVKTYLVPKLGSVRLAELKAGHLDGYLAALRADGKSAYTANYTLTVLKRALRKALKQDRLPKDPFVGLERPRHEKKAQNPWSVGELNVFLAANAEERLYPLYVLALTHGMRQGELLGLQWHEVDLDAKTVRVEYQLIERGGVLYGRQPPKSKAGRRTVHLSKTAAEALRALRARVSAEAMRDGKRPSEWVFATGEGGPYRKANLHVAFKAAIRRAGVKEIRFHDLRHTKATLALARGGDIKQLQEEIGHSDIKVTLGTYYHPDVGVHRAAADRTDEIFGTTGGTNGGGK